MRKLVMNMVNKKLTINGLKITKENDVLAFFKEKRFSCNIDEYYLEVEFSANGNAFIGWLNGDEEVYYFNNGSGNTDSVELLINICPEERMMCYDMAVMRDIVLYFCESGLRHPKYDWISDEFQQ